MTTTNTQTADVATLALKVADLSKAVTEIDALALTLFEMERTVEGLIKRGHLPANVINFRALREALTASSTRFELAQTLNDIAAK